MLRRFFSGLAVKPAPSFEIDIALLAVCEDLSRTLTHVQNVGFALSDKSVDAHAAYEAAPRPMPDAIGLVQVYPDQWQRHEALIKVARQTHYRLVEAMTSNLPREQKVALHPAQLAMYHLMNDPRLAEVEYAAKLAHTDIRVLQMQSAYGAQVRYE